MDGDPHVTAHRLPGSLRDAVARGWTGLAIASVVPPGPVVCAAAVDADRVAALAAQGLAIGLPAGPLRARPGRPRRVALSLAADPSVAVTMDLAFADARRAAERIGASARVCLLWMAAGSGIPLRADMVPLDHCTARRVCLEAALSGEWRVDDPRPAGFSRLGWWREAAGPGSGRLVCGDLAGARVAVVAPIGPAHAPPNPDEGVSIPFGAGPPVPEADRHVWVDLSAPRQRAMARQLLAQDAVAVHLVDPNAGGEWVARIMVAVDDRLRQGITDAVSHVGVASAEN